jgi:adenylate cyclase
LSSFKVEDLYEARRLLQHSLSSDPDYPRAHAAISRTHLRAWLDSVDSDFLNPAALDRAYQSARKAVELDPNLPQAHAYLGIVLSFQGRHDAALAEFEKAIALNPNFTDYRFAAALVRAAEAGRAIEVAEKHMRLDPFYPPMAPGWLGFAHYMLKEYSKALPPLRECVSRAPNFRVGRAWLAATYAQLGRLEDGTQRRLGAYKRPEDVEHFFDGLRKAGLPS